MYPLSALEIAVIPYEVGVADRDFTAETGTEYAKLISLAGAIDKGVSVYSFRALERDLSSQGLDPQKTITANDINAFLASRYLPYAIVGRISKTSTGFVSQSILYSASHKAIVARAKGSGTTLAECATREAKELYSRFADIERQSVKRNTVYDIAVLVDSTYSVNTDLSDIRSSVESFVSESIESFPGTNVYIIPFNDTALRSFPDPCQTVPAVRNSIASIKPKAGARVSVLGDAIESSLENIPWRSDASRAMIVFASSPAKSPLSDKAIRIAKRKHVAVHSVALGYSPVRDIEMLRRIASGTGGTFSSVSYRQTLYDNNGDVYGLFLHKGRIFEGSMDWTGWVNGVIREKTTGSFYEMVPSEADEVILPQGTAANPLSMVQLYKKKGTKSVLNSGEIRSNISRIMQTVEDTFSIGSRSAPVKSTARVLLSHNNTSIWVSVPDQQTLSFFTKQKALGFVFPLGVRISLKKDEPYGFTFNSSQFITGYDWENLPDAARTSLEEVVKNPARFAKEGLFAPPVWFVNVKVDEINDRTVANDIRDDR